MTKSKSVVTALAVFGAMMSFAKADETITLRVAHSLPANHFLWERGMKEYTDAVTEVTNGKVKFEVYPSGQLGSDYHGLLTSGLADVAMVVGYYQPEKFPLTSVIELPGMYSSSCEATAKYDALAKPGGLLDEMEYKPLGIRALYVNVMSSFRLMTASRKVDSLQEASGLKLWANGAAIGKTISSFGAIPIRMTGPELYDSVTRGTLDGALFPYSSVLQYDLADKLKYVLEGTQFGAGGWMMAISEKSWNGLPSDVQEAMISASPAAQQSLCSWSDEDSEKTRNKLVADHGTVVSELPPDQVALLKEKYDALAKAWADDMDAFSGKGSILVEAFRQAGAE